MMLKPIMLAAAIRMRVEVAAVIISNPNMSMTDATTEATTGSLVSTNCLRRISNAEVSIPGPSPPLLSENSHARELAKLKVGVRRLTKRSPRNGATAGISWPKPRNVNPRNIQEPSPKLMNI